MKENTLPYVVQQGKFIITSETNKVRSYLGTPNTTSATFPDDTAVLPTQQHHPTTPSDQMRTIMA